MILWLNPFSGVSGDMLLGALLDLGAPLDEVRTAVSSTGLDGWKLSTEQVNKGGINAIRAVVEVTDTATERSAAELLDLVSDARPTPVADLATAAIGALAETEAALHGQHPDDVHLHEVGGLDTVVDTVGVAAALHGLGVEQVHSAPVALGNGTVHCQHGLLPAPAPATLALLRDAQVVGAEVTAETVTPTGAALLRAIGTTYGSPPSMTLTATGYGAGTRDFPARPNVLPATLGSAPQASPARTMPQVVLETNLDDVTGELLGHLIDAALQAGAADAWITPATMKKSRPAHVMHVLCPPEREAQLSRVLFSETGSLGVRRYTVDKTELHREVDTVTVHGHRIRMKYGPWHAKPEHDDVVTVATALGLPLREVIEAALLAHHTGE